MNFDAWWDFIKWTGIPAAAALLWWVRDLQSRHRHVVEKLYARIDSETTARHAEAEACRREHRNAISEVRADFNEYKLESVSKFASAESLEKGIDRLESAIEKLGNRLERFIENTRDSVRK